MQYRYTTSPQALIAVSLALIGWAFFETGLTGGVGQVMMAVGAGLIAIFFFADLRAIGPGEDHEDPDDHEPMARGDA